MLYFSELMAKASGDIFSKVRGLCLIHCVSSHLKKKVQQNQLNVEELSGFASFAGAFYIWLIAGLL